MAIRAKKKQEEYNALDAKKNASNLSDGMLRFNCVRPAVNVAYSLLFIALALVCGCFDPPAAKRRRRAARYTPRENEILDLLGADMVWLDQVEPAEARALAQKMRDNGDCELISEIYEGLRARGRDE